MKNSSTGRLLLVLLIAIVFVVSQPLLGEDAMPVPQAPVEQQAESNPAKEAGRFSGAVAVSGILLLAAVVATVVIVIVRRHSGTPTVDEV